MGIGPLEIGIVLVIVLIIFGPKRLPQLGRSIGSGMREFKDAVTKRGGDEPRELGLPEEAETETSDGDPADRS